MAGESPSVSEDTLTTLLERLRREPTLRTWVLDAPTGALASLGVTLDDDEIVTLLDQIEAMDDRALPVTVADVMTPDPFVITPDDTVHEAARLLAERRISGLPVCDAQGNLVGIVSEFDLIARSGRTVGEVMTHEVTSVREDATLDTVRTMIVSRRLKRLPVVDRGGRLTGIVSRADLVRELSYRWTCKRCGNLIRARRPPEGCPRCGAAESFVAAPPLPEVSACPTCGQPVAV